MTMFIIRTFPKNLIAKYGTFVTAQHTENTASSTVWKVGKTSICTILKYL